MAEEPRDVWDPNLEVGDPVTFETIGGNWIKGTVESIDPDDPCFVKIAIKGYNHPLAFARVINIPDDEEFHGHFIKPPFVKITPKKEIIERFVEEGGDKE